MRASAAPLFSLALVACAAAADPPTPPQPEAAAPQRIISLDYCADQFVLGLADRTQIAALSPHAEHDYAFFAEAAAGLPQVPPRLEEIMALRPDLVVRTYGGGFAVSGQLARLGVPVLDLGFADDFDAIAQTTRRAAEAFGHAERGEAAAAAMRETLTPAPPTGLRALYVTPGGATAGRGGLIDQLFASAGLANAITTPGWPTLPLEEIALNPPDVIVTAFYGSAYAGVDSWSVSQHPVLERLMQERPVIALSAAEVSCGGWFMAEAAEALRAGAPPKDSGP